LWASQQAPLLSSYVSLVGELYGAGAFNVDFASDPGLSRKTINLWAGKETRGLITELIPEGFITPVTRLILTNAVYFKGDWRYPFDVRSTRNEDFRLDDNRTVSVPMMFLEGNDMARLNYARLPEGQILELPYAGGKLSMLVLLPAPEAAQAFESGLSLEKLAQWKQSLMPQKVDVYLPRFVFSFSDKMREVLQAMGITDAFGPQADFSRMTGQKDIYIGEVIHKAFIEVNEQGTKAAAATAAGMFGGAMPRPAQLFRADRPFMFLIQESGSGRIIFMGRLSRP
jgi:serpin B